MFNYATALNVIWQNANYNRERQNQLLNENGHSLKCKDLS